MFGLGAEKIDHIGGLMIMHQGNQIFKGIGDLQLSYHQKLGNVSNK
jgi:hypothetical protein